MGTVLRVCTPSIRAIVGRENTPTCGRVSGGPAVRAVANRRGFGAENDFRRAWSPGGIASPTGAARPVTKWGFGGIIGPHFNNLARGCSPFDPCEDTERALTQNTTYWDLPVAVPSIRARILKGAPLIAALRLPTCCSPFDPCEDTESHRRGGAPGPLPGQLQSLRSVRGY